MDQGAKVTLGMAKGSMTDGRHAREYSTAAKDPRRSRIESRRPTCHGVEFTSNQQILRKEMQQNVAAAFPAEEGLRAPPTPHAVLSRGKRSRSPF